jgi:hypothetical protein
VDEKVGTSNLVAPFLHGTQVIIWQGKSVSKACVKSTTMARLSFHITLVMPHDLCILQANTLCDACLNTHDFLNSRGIFT